MKRPTEPKPDPDRFLTPSQRLALRLQALRAAPSPKHEAHAEAGIPASSPRPPAAGVRTGSEGDAPLVDARALDQRSYFAHLHGLGLDTSQLEVRSRPLPPPLAPEVVAAQEEVRLVAEMRLEARAKAIEAGRIDGRTATPQEVCDRLREIGIDPAPLALGFIPVGQPLKPLPAPADHTRIAAGKATDAVRQLLATGKPVDTRRLSREEFVAFRKLTGLVEG